MLVLRRGKDGTLGAARVRMEAAAGVMERMGRALRAGDKPDDDTAEILRELKKRTCECCPVRNGCVEQKMLSRKALLAGNFLCRKAEHMASELERSRMLLSRVRYLDARQTEFRMAAAKQYETLASTLRSISDLMEREPEVRPIHRLLLSARSRGAKKENGDHVSVFGAAGGSIYVLLCDGMGTGREAAAQSRQTAASIRQMLRCGMPPEAALENVNIQLALSGRAGAVTVDMAKLRCDSSVVTVYKWGAQPSILLTGHGAKQAGKSGPPPGLEVGQHGQSVSRIRLARGDSLLLLSDGIRQTDAPLWDRLPKSLPPGQLAAQILKTAAEERDDATVVVIRFGKRAGKKPPESG